MLDLFVYGTLRPGCDLAHLLEQSYAGTPRLATVNGTLHYHASGHGYPVFRPNKADITTGHLLRLYEDGDTRYTILMELSAGYEARWLQVRDARTGKRITQDGTALVFTWPDDEPVGAQVHGNDWMNTIPGVPAWV